MFSFSRCTRRHSQGFIVRVRPRLELWSREWLLESYRLLMILHGSHIVYSVFNSFPSYFKTMTAVAIFCCCPLRLLANVDVLIQMITTAMGVFSVYLLSLLKFKIGYPCPWCLTSVGVTDRNRGQCLVLYSRACCRKHSYRGNYRNIVIVLPASWRLMRHLMACVLVKPALSWALGTLNLALALDLTIWVVIFRSHMDVQGTCC